MINCQMKTKTFDIAQCAGRFFDFCDVETMGLDDLVGATPEGIDEALGALTSLDPARMATVVRRCVEFLKKNSEGPLDVVSRSSILEERLDLVKRKNADYGQSAFSVPSLAPSVTIADAILTRMSDKRMRIKNLTTGHVDSVGEKLADTVADVIGYTFLLWCVVTNGGEA